MMAILDDVRARLGRVFQAADGAFSFAVSGTGTSGMETAVATLTDPGTRAVAVVNGYFGDRLAQMLQRYGATVTRVEGEWGRAIDPARLEKALAAGADLVTMVHAETSTGVLNPVAELCRVAAARGAKTIVDCVTSLGAHPVDARAWGADAVYSCTQKGLGAPSGLAPVTFPRRQARDCRLLSRRAAAARLLGQPQIPPHDQRAARLRTAGSADRRRGGRPRAALGPSPRQSRSARRRRSRGIGLELLPPPAERLWSLNTVKVPEGVDEAAVRKALLAEHGIEIGAGLGPLAGKIWRIGLMGSGSTRENVSRLVSALAGLIRR